MPFLIIGLILLVIGAQGNAPNLITNLENGDYKTFLPWILAVGGLYAIYKYTPSKYQSISHLLIGLSLLGIVIVNFDKVKTLTSTALTALGIKQTNPGQTNNQLTNS